jgi:NAD(P)-dependent dehydrogenase (short-subunit alcohol dehydrogenase family)
MEFKNKVAVITGGASGIGKSIALAMARLGTDIVIADLDDVRLEEVRQQIQGMGRRVLAVHCDVSKNADVDNLAAQTLSTMGKADILVNNAGVMLQGSIEGQSMADWEWIIGINLLGVIRSIHAFLPDMLKRGSGYILNTASIAGLLYTFDIAYSTSKFGVVGLSEGLFAYLRPKGIMVSVLCPSLVDTNLRFTTRIVGDEKEVNDLKLGIDTMFKSPGVISPDDVAQMVVDSMNQGKFMILTHPENYIMLEEQGKDVKKLEKHLQDRFREIK